MNPEAPPQRTVQAGPLRWRVLQAGCGPSLLLLHGTGSSAQSWSACLPLLSAHYRVLVPDLPGHGGSASWPDRQASLPRMAEALGQLVRQLGEPPSLVVGHSAGAAVMLQMALSGQIAPRGLLALNGALMPLQGLPGLLFPPLARVMARQTWLPALVARHASRPQALSRLIGGTGSRLSAEQVGHYRDLLTQAGHIGGALDMMAGWKLDALLAALPRLRVPLWLAAGLADRAVPAWQAQHLAARLPTASFHPLPGLGHLAHEEAPGRVVALVDALWDQVVRREIAP